MKSIIAVLCFFVLWLQTLISHGQSEPASEARDGAQTSEIVVIALGPRPQRKFRETDDGDAAVMLLAQPGETPPSRLFYQDDSIRDAEKKWTSFNLAFNNSSTFRKTVPGRELKLHQRKAGGEAYDVYVSLPAVPPASRTIFFLTPKSLGPKPWEDFPAVRSLGLENAELADKQFILANFSKHSVQHAFEDSIEVVRPNQILSYQRDQVGQIYRLAARYGREQKIIYNTAVRLNEEGHAQLFVLYDANPETNAGRDVGVFRMMIPARESEMLPGASSE